MLSARTIVVATYETDFHAWTGEQAELLRRGKWEQLDVENLAEELESLGRQERQELTHRLGILLGHLLKSEYQFDQRSNSWLATIREQRRQARKLLQENPSLQPRLEALLAEAYEDGLDLAVRETNLPYDTFPRTCPYPIERIFDSSDW